MKVCVSTSVKRMKDKPRSNPNYHIFLKYLFIIYFFVGKIDISFFLYAHKKQKKKHPTFHFFFYLKKKNGLLTRKWTPTMYKVSLTVVVNNWVKHSERLG